MHAGQRFSGDYPDGDDPSYTGDLGGYAYTAFGKRLSGSEAGGLEVPVRFGQPFTWQGKRGLGAANLYYSRARIWSAELGTFLQPDQYAYLSRGGTLWSWPGQNPFRWRDPSGRFVGLEEYWRARPYAMRALQILRPFAPAGAAAAAAGLSLAVFADQVNGLGAEIFAQQDANLNAIAKTAARERAKSDCPQTEAGGGAGRGGVPPSSAAEAADDDRLPRFNGPKPGYAVNPAHVPGRGLRAGKTPLPGDAEEVFSRAVPNDPENPTAWFGRSNAGKIYRFSLGNDGTAHFSGIHGVGSGTRNITQYALDRLGFR